MQKVDRFFCYTGVAVLFIASFWAGKLTERAQLSKRLDATTAAVSSNAELK